MKLQDIYAKTLQDNGFVEAGGSSKFRRFSHADYHADVLLGKAGGVRVTHGPIANSRPMNESSKQRMVIGQVPLGRKTDTDRAQDAARSMTAHRQRAAGRLARSVQFQQDTRQALMNSGMVFDHPTIKHLDAAIGELQEAVIALKEV